MRILILGKFSLSMKLRREYQKKEITLKDYQIIWLKEHKSDVNFSGYCQDKTDELMKHIEKLNRAIQKEVSIPTGRY